MEINRNHLHNLALSETGFLFDPRNGNTFILNETASRILQLLKEGETEEQILNDILETYDVDSFQAERDLSDLLLQMQELGVLK